MFLGGLHLTPQFETTTTTKIDLFGQFFLLPCKGLGVLCGRSMESVPKSIIVRFKHHHFRYPKTPFLALGVQRYACLERHPRTHLIFSGSVQFKDTPCRDPKTPFLAQGVQRYGWLGRHTQNPQHIFWHVPVTKSVMDWRDTPANF